MNYSCIKDKFYIADWIIISLKKNKNYSFKYRQEPSDRILTHSRSQESIPMELWAAYSDITFIKACYGGIIR